MPEAEAKPRRRGIPALDGLRGVAALVVVVRHAFNAVAMPVAERAEWIAGPLAPLLNSQGAVQLFFVLSGYVLAGSIERCRSLADWPQFWIKRVFRIHPPYVFGVLLAWGLAFVAFVPVHLGVTRWLMEFLSIHIGVGALLRSLVFPGIAQGQFPVGWTLTVEMVFSLALPLLVALARPLRGLLLFGVSLALLELSPLPIGRYAIDFALGVLAWREREHLGRGLAALPAWLRDIGLPLMGLALFCAPMWLRWFVVQGDSVYHGFASRDLVVMGAGNVLLVIAAATPGPLQRALTWAPVGHVGRISYSIYLVHFPLLLLLAPRLVQPDGGASLLVLLAALLPLTIGVSDLAYRWIERPSIALGNRTCQRWARRAGRGALETRLR